MAQATLNVGGRESRKTMGSMYQQSLNQGFFRRPHPSFPLCDKIYGLGLSFAFSFYLLQFSTQAMHRLCLRRAQVTVFHCGEGGKSNQAQPRFFKMNFAAAVYTTTLRFKCLLSLMRSSIFLDITDINPFFGS